MQINGFGKPVPHPYLGNAISTSRILQMGGWKCLGRECLACCDMVLDGDLGLWLHSGFRLIITSLCTRVTRSCPNRHGSNGLLEHENLIYWHSGFTHDLW